MRYFIFGYSLMAPNTHYLNHMGVGFPQEEFPSHTLIKDTIVNNTKEGKRLIEAGLDPKINIQIVILGITELSEKDYKSFFELS